MRAPIHCTLGDKAVTVLPDGRVLVALPPVNLPCGASMNATITYASLAACLAQHRTGAMRLKR